MGFVGFDCKIIVLLFSFIFLLGTMIDQRVSSDWDCGERMQFEEGRSWLDNEIGYNGARW